MKTHSVAVAATALAACMLGGLGVQAVADPVHDPGVRPSTLAAALPIANLGNDERVYFDAGLAEFSDSEGVGDGLGPRFNLDSCAGCHQQPVPGGTSPAVNPQVTVATAFGARNALPSFISSNGPIREARFRVAPNGARDGGVHALFVVSGRHDASGDASGCGITQDNFDAQFAHNNVALRIPTPVFGAGLIEQIPDAVLLANLAAFPAQKARLGISGRANRSGNDGTVARFGWKAQNASLLIFSGEADNVEMGVTNEIFGSEREQDLGCQFATLPNDHTVVAGATGVDSLSGVEKFALFMRFLAPPTRSPDTPGGSASIMRGGSLFASIGCGYCHTPRLATGNSTVAALRKQNVDLFSDLALHQMGPRLADNILQGGAAGDEFRTAPLWGLGQRIFFLHDGRTSDLVEAIEAHASGGLRGGFGASSQFGPSEANRVIDIFNTLPPVGQQDLLNFLRSL
jgi:CxxC motif-containing protein (DUF1111 family)